ncbi:MAG: mevalonate kinase [Tenericutes bacterium ADurb.Bin087]|nr:MAG: mevalonate kinase [Tenericutes bacterium ADurb.Bin087]
MRIHEKVPGKLYVIGEYNVLKSGHGAIVAPVNLFLQGTLVANHKTTIIEGDIAHPYHVLLENGCPHQLKNTVATITFFNEYLALKGIPLKEFEYTIENNLISDEQVKFGLGSSAASVVLTLKLLNRLYCTNLSPLVLFKMAVLIQKELGSLTSGGDLACTIFDVPLYYVRYDLNWLLKEKRIFELLEEEWPFLKIKLLTKLPTFLVGWTKETITPDTNGIIDASFYKRANKLVHNYLVTYDDIYIRQYQDLLEELGLKRSGMITPRLEALVKSANELGVAAKISGAGYGDCGIAQINDQSVIEPLTKIWENNGIIVLDIWRKDNE